MIKLPDFKDLRGSLSFAETGNHIPFLVKRIFYMYDVPLGSIRGEHAHKELHQFIVCLHGVIEVETDNGKEKVKYSLDRPNLGIHIPPLTWTTVKFIKKESVCVVLCSDVYDKLDYILNYTEFLDFHKLPK